MDSDLPLSNQENDEPKAEFRKLTNEAANRKYRRRSPVGGSSEEDGSPRHDHSSRGNSKVSDYDRRNGDRMDDRTSSRSQHGRSGNSDRYSSRSYQSRHDDHYRHGKYADEDDRGYAKLSSRSIRESRGGGHSDYRDREGDYNRSREYNRDGNRYSRDRSDAADRKYKGGYDGRHGSRYDDRDRRARDRDDRDEKRDHRSSRDHKSDHTTYNEDSKGNQSDSSSKREAGELKDLNGSKYNQEVKNKNDELDRHKAGYVEVGGRSEVEDFAIKRPKFNSGETDAREADERQTIGQKHAEEHVAKVTLEQATVNVPGTSSVDAAKVAAMKAAELVNKNLSSTGFMTADQKKKLLWGSKKNNSTEESSHRWDTTLFPDRERQEKFNKLMSLRLPWYIWPIVGFEGRGEGGLETPRCREAERTSAGFGEAIYGWAPEEGRSHGGVRSVGFNLGCCLSTETVSGCLILFVCIRILVICSTSDFSTCCQKNLGFFCLFSFFCCGKFWALGRSGIPFSPAWQHKGKKRTGMSLAYKFLGRSGFIYPITQTLFY